MPSESSLRRLRSGRISSAPESGDDQAEVAPSRSSASGESSSESSSEEEEDVARKRQKNAVRADLTPHHRLEKRPQRRTAARASEAWNGLRRGLTSSISTSSILDDVPFAVVIDNRSSSEQRRDATKRKIKAPNRSSPELIVSTPVEKRCLNGKGKDRETQDEVLTTPRGKRKATDNHTNGPKSSSSKLRENGNVIATVSTPNGKSKGKEAVVYTPSKKQIMPTTPSRKKPIPITPSKSSAPKLVGDVRLSQSKERLASDQLFIQPTSSDAYFANHAPRKQRGAAYQTSDNTISGTMEPISAQVISELSSKISRQIKASGDDDEILSLMSTRHYQAHYEYWWSILVNLNRPLLFHGIGSKRAHLQAFAKHYSQKAYCSVAVILGDSGGRIEDVLKELEAYTGKAATSTDQTKIYSTTLEARAHSIANAFKNKSHTPKRKLPPYFMILIHNFDTAIMMHKRSLHILSILCSTLRILLCVDVCHINSGLLSFLHSDLEHGSLNWLWISMNTYVPMIEEMTSQRGISIARAMGLPRVLDIRSGGGTLLADELNDTAQGSSSFAVLTERAATHILRSVTSKALKLFLLLANEIVAKGKTSISSEEVAELARTNFLSSSTEALRSLLVEFTSHGLIRTQGTDNGGQHTQNVPLPGSTISIALSKKDLESVIAQFGSKKI